MVHLNGLLEPFEGMILLTKHRIVDGNLKWGWILTVESLQIELQLLSASRVCPSIYCIAMKLVPSASPIS